MAKQRAQGSVSTPSSAPLQLDALIIGAGFSGLYQLHCLRGKLGLSVHVVEAGDGVGGTWYWNRYPGARCDSESHSYCYSFSDELHQAWTWSERYPAQPEVLRYLNFVADRLDLRRDISFGTRVTSAHYDEGQNRWLVETDQGVSYAATYLIAAVGCLSSANVPALPGIETFRGRTLHTGQWPHEGVDFTGLRVGQIGTGSTGIQTAPVIAETAKHLTVFQRTANYSVPARNEPLTADFQRWTKSHFEEIKAVMHSTPNGHPFRIEERSAFDVSDAERRTIYEKAWEKGGLQFRATFKDLVLDKRANDTATEFLKAKIRGVVKDPATADLLADIDHPYAGKRPPIDTNYFETFNRPNVTLVDVRSDPIEAITLTGLKTSKAHYDLDMIVFATGFDAMTGPLLRLDIRGRDGVNLRDVWADGPLTYLGLQVPGFPNLFTVTGPGSPSVLCNMPVAIEQHVDWITECIRHLRATGANAIEAEKAAAERWGAACNDAAAPTVLALATGSWYWGANIPGKPRAFMPYAGGMARYRKLCDEAAAKGYEGFVVR